MQKNPNKNYYSPRKHDYQRKRRMKRPFPQENDDNLIIKQICNQNTTIEEQLSLIIKHIEAEPIYYKYIENIYQSVNILMKFYYQDKCKDIKIFGSAITQLALKNSDVDIFLDFEGNLPFDMKIFTKILRNQIMKKSRSFSRAIAIPARVPIVKCTHLGTGINCDISFTNYSGVLNSYVIKFFLNLDNRIRPLILILKFLMKKGLMGINSVSSYVLVNLVLYFLQQLEQPLVPTVSYLQEKGIIQQILNCNDSNSINTYLPSTINSSSVVELLQQFFQFYATFEFGLYVISSFTGKSYLKPFFNDVESLPDEFSSYKEEVKNQKKCPFDCRKILCIQCPLNHSINIASNISSKILQKFQKYCSEKMVIPCQTMKEKSEYFKELFKPKLPENTKVRKTEPEIVIYLDTGINFENPHITEEELRKKWFEGTLEKLNEFLIKIMKCSVDCSVKSSSNSVDLKILNCEMKCFELVTKKRKIIKQNLEFSPNLSIIEKEEIITNEMYENFIVNNMMSYKFQIRCFVKKRPTAFCIQLQSKEDTNKKQHFIDNIFHFIFEYFPKLMI